MRRIKLRDISGGVDHALLERGRIGRGVVSGVECERAVNAGSAECRVCSLTVRVYLDGEEPYVATVRQRIPVERLPTVTSPSARVVVRVHPADRHKIAIDFAATA